MLAMFGLASSLFPQPPIGDFYYTLTPKVATSGQRVTFEAFEYNACLYSYDVSYELLPTPISSKRTTLINIKAIQGPNCATLMGYSGPKIEFENFQIGLYKIQFDSTSDFKKDLGDSSYFEVIGASFINIPEKMGVPEKIPVNDPAWHLVNGRKISSFGNYFHIRVRENP